MHEEGSVTDLLFFLLLLSLLFSSSGAGAASGSTTTARGSGTTRGDGRELGGTLSDQLQSLLVAM